MDGKPVFFYGLFMDPDLLRQSGFDPSAPMVAELTDYKFQIGERATLIVSNIESSWGTIMSLTEEELAKLYSAPSVSDYKPVSVMCRLDDGKEKAADVYILPEDYPLAPPKDRKYIDQLIEICRKMKLPKNYISQLQMISDDINE